MSKATRAITMIGLALVLAAGAGIIVFNWANNVGTRQAGVGPAQKTVQVVVSKTDLKRGATLGEAMLETKTYLEDSRPSGAFVDPKLLTGRVLKAPVGANEAITESKLASPDTTGGGVSALITPGKRAMAVKGNAVMGLAGFIRPGDRVDVIATLTTGRDEIPVTKVVLEQVKVIATGTQLDPPDEEGTTASVDVYTLELTPEESERLALAATQGTLNLALRNALDKETVLTTGSTVDKALASLRPQPKKAARVVAGPGVDVEVFTGTDREVIKFKGERK